MSTVQSIERAFALLEALAVTPAGVSDLAARVDLPKSTVARLLATLEARHAVERVPGDLRYRLGPAIATLASAVAPDRNLIALARSHLIDLTAQVGEATGLSIPDGDDVHYIDQVDGPSPVQVRDWTGTWIPMHVVSSGLVCLADWPPARLNRYLARDLDRPTANTVTEPRAVKHRLKTIAAQGYAWVFEEFAEGINSVAAPIRQESGAVLAAMHIHGPAYRFPGDRDPERIAERVSTAAHRVSSQLGHSSD